VISSQFLRKQRKWAIVLIFVVAAALTPGPDVFSQLMMAGPLLILYEVSVWIAYFCGRKKTTDEEAEDTPAEEQPHSASGIQ
jgi:sec-independent protein translocase protein TatC